MILDPYKAFGNVILARGLLRRAVVLSLLP